MMNKKITYSALAALPLLAAAGFYFFSSDEVSKSNDEVTTGQSVSNSAVIDDATLGGDEDNHLALTAENDFAVDLNQEAKQPNNDASSASSPLDDKTLRTKSSPSTKSPQLSLDETDELERKAAQAAIRAANLLK